MPQKTIKTVLYHLVQMFGNDILSYLAQVPNSQGSEVQRYIMKDLNVSPISFERNKKFQRELLSHLLRFGRVFKSYP